jgi:CrcB protein
MIAWRVFWIMLGGAVGSLSRWGLATAVHRWSASAFPWGTFAVNVLGCLLFGFVAGLWEDRPMGNPSTRAFLMIGFLGGFTTFSTFTWESFVLLRQSHIGKAMANVSAQVVLGLAALWLGWALARAIRHTP